MRIAEIFKGKLYRLYTNRIIKDIKVKDGVIQEPENDFDILTDTELEFVKLNIK